MDRLDVLWVGDTSDWESPTLIPIRGCGLNKGKRVDMGH
jgi:hypothetical protein